MIASKTAIAQPTLAATMPGLRESLFQMNGGRCRATALQGYFKLLIANEVAYFSGSAGSKMPPSKNFSGSEFAPP